MFDSSDDSFFENAGFLPVYDASGNVVDTISAGPIINSPGITGDPSVSAPTGNGTVGGILNGIASIVSAGAKFVQPSGAVPRTLYRPLPSSPVGASVGSGGGLILLFGLGAAAFLFLRKKAA